MVKMKINEFIEKVKELGLEITDEKLKQLEIYANFLREYNEHTNLTAITNIEDIYLKHFYDSLTLTKVIDLNICENLLDFGTGAGFPGMVIKIFFPSLKVTLLDSNNKKIKFLTELKDKIHVDNLELINTRVESLRNERINYYKKASKYSVDNVGEIKKIVKLSTCSYLNNHTTPTEQRYYIVAKLEKVN